MYVFTINKLKKIRLKNKVNRNKAVHLVTMEVDIFLDITKHIRKEEMRIKTSLDSSKELGI